MERERAGAGNAQRVLINAGTAFLEAGAVEIKGFENAFGKLTTAASSLDSVGAGLGHSASMLANAAASLSEAAASLSGGGGANLSPSASAPLSASLAGLEGVFEAASKINPIKAKMAALSLSIFAGGVEKAMARLSGIDASANEGASASMAFLKGAVDASAMITPKAAARFQISFSKLASGMASGMASMGRAGKNAKAVGDGIKLLSAITKHISKGPKLSKKDAYSLTAGFKIIGERLGGATDALLAPFGALTAGAPILEAGGDALSKITGILAYSLPDINEALKAKPPKQNGLSALFGMLSESMEKLRGISDGGLADALKKIGDGLAPLHSLLTIKMPKKGGISDGISRIGDVLAKIGDKGAAMEKGASAVALSLNKLSVALNAAGMERAPLVAKSLGLLGLSIVGFAILTGTGLTLLAAAGIGVLGLALRTLSDKKELKQFAMFNASLALLGLSIWAFSEIMTLETMGKSIAGLIALNLALRLFGDGGKGKGGAKSALIGAASVAAFGLAMHLWAGVEWGTALTAAAAIAGIGLAMKAFGSASPLGAVSLLAASASVAALGYGISLFPDDVSKLLPIGLFIGGLGLSTYLFGNPIALAGAAALALVGAGVAAIGLGIKIISGVGDPAEAGEAFGTALISIAYAFAELGNPLVLIPALAGSVAGVALGASSLVVGASLALMNAINIKPERIERFGEGLGYLADAYDSLGAFSLAKSVAKSLLVVPISAATLIAAASIRAIQAINIDPAKIGVGAAGIGVFITSITGVLDENKGRMESAEAGIEALMDLGNMVKGVADGVFSVANLEFIETEVRNGQIVPLKTRKLTNADFDAVGTSLGAIITALSKPLADIGRQDSGWFSSSDVEKGIEALSGIGNVFVPIADMVRAFADMGAGAKGATEFGDKVSAVVVSLSKAFAEAAENEGFEDFELGGDAEDFLDYLKDKDFIKGAEAVGTKLGGGLKILRGELAGIDLSKLAALKSITENLLAAGKDGELAELLKELVRLFSKLDVSKGGDKNEETTNNYNTASKRPDIVRVVENKASEKQVFDEAHNKEMLAQLKIAVSHLGELSGSLIQPILVKTMPQ